MAKFLKCKRCGKIVEVINDGAPETVCCGEPMVELKANTTDAATEKHVPVIEIVGDKVAVSVGSVVHPMEAAHYIQWIAIETNRGVYRKNLNPGEEPKASFILSDEKLIAAYEYCNLHGLWKAEA